MTDDHSNHPLSNRSEPATLATVKHGGCVQLADELPPLPKSGYVTGGDFGHEAHNAFTPEQMQDYARAAIVAALSAQPSPGGQGDELDLDCVLSLADVHAEESREDGVRLLDRGGLLAFAQDVVSALAARQPDTDEQYADEQALIDHLDELMDDGGQGGEKWPPAQAAIAGIIAARQPVASNQPSGNSGELAVDGARQPVGEPVCSGGFVIANGSGEKYMAWGQVGPEWVADRSAALWLVRRADAEALAAENEDAWSILPVERCALPPSRWACTLADGHEGPCPTIAAPPAQQADQEYLESLDRALEGVIDQRDRYHEMADDLAGHIAAITGVDLGEHSSANCPWQNAIEAAEEYKPAQAVDLGAVREALQAAEGLATICASVDGYSREEVAASGRAMRQLFADALAKVDSQAVGK